MIDYAKRFRVQESRRHFTVFCNIVRHKILPYAYPDGRYNGVEVFVGQHFAERMVDREFKADFTSRILSYVFEKHMDKLHQDVDTFIHYGSVAILLNSKFKEDGVLRVRLNTVIEFVGDNFAKEKKQIPLQHIVIDSNELVGYKPISYDVKL